MVSPPPVSAEQLRHAARLLTAAWLTGAGEHLADVADLLDRLADAAGDRQHRVAQLVGERFSSFEPAHRTPPPCRTSPRGPGPAPSSGGAA